MRVARQTMADWSEALSKLPISNLLSNRDYSDLECQSEQLRLWLPEAAKIALEEVCQYNESSMTVYLVEFFTTYLYGHHQLLLMRANRSGIYEHRHAPPPWRTNRPKASFDTGIQMSEPENLGKNIFPVKIFLPHKIKWGLKESAEQSAMSMGVFCRHLICAHLFGKSYQPEKLGRWSASEEQLACEWEAECES